jgi:diacylglycerol kinase family enzyme
MDVGLCGEEPFLMMVSSGLDARILRYQNPRWKAILGPPAVALAGLCQWWRDAYPTLEVEVEGRRLEGTFLSICNIPHYGGPFRLAPEARIDDGWLHLVLLRAARRARTLSFAFSLALGRHARRPDVIIQPVQEVRIVAPSAPDLQLDGDPLPRVEASVTIRPAAEKLWVLAGDQVP